MTIPEHLIHELLDLTRLSANVPFVAIFTFVSYKDKRSLSYFNENIYFPMTRGRIDYGWKVESLLVEIRGELLKAEITP